MMRTFGLLIFLVAEAASISNIYVDQNCGKIFNLLDLEARVRATNTIGNYLPVNANCTITINVKVPYPGIPRAVADVRSISLPTSLGGACDRARLDILDGNSVISGSSGLCGYAIYNDYATRNTGTIGVRLSTDGISRVGNFEVIVTPFHHSPCYANEFACSNGRCINSQLECNGRDNCGDNSDEVTDHCAVVVLAAGAIAGIVIGCLIVVCAPCIIIGLICTRRRRRVVYGQI